MRSAGNQVFVVNQPSTAIEPIIITESSTGAAITATDDIRLIIPDTLKMTWDSNVTTPTIRGLARDKVSPTVTYENSAKTAVLKVIADFKPEDEIQITDLKFTNFTEACGPDKLQMFLPNQGISIQDNRTILITLVASGPAISNVKISGQPLVSGDAIPSLPYLTADIDTTSSLDIRKDSLKLFWDDGPAVTPSITPADPLAPSYTISYQLPPPGLSAGTHSLKITAADIVGNSSTAEYSGLKVYAAAQIVGTPLSYPSVFSPAKGENTKFTYQLGTDTTVTIYLFNLTGQCVWQKTYLSGTSGGRVGYNEVVWDGLTDFGRLAGNGVYIYKIVSGGKVLGTGQVAVRD